MGATFWFKFRLKFQTIYWRGIEWKWTERDSKNFHFLHKELIKCPFELTLDCVSLFNFGFIRYICTHHISLIQMNTEFIWKTIYWHAENRKDLFERQMQCVVGLKAQMTVSIISNEFICYVLRLSSALHKTKAVYTHRPNAIVIHCVRSVVGTISRGYK